MHFLFLFLDGVGLGSSDPAINPFANSVMPNLQALLGGKRMLAGEDLPIHTESASLLALDACLGVPGLPQSATGQAVILTGINIPAQLGYHYGPKPNPAIAKYLTNGNIFSQLTQNNRTAALLNAYPPGYFHSIASGRRLYSAIPLAVTSAGLPLMNTDDLISGRALSADFTAHGWHENLNQPDIPLLTPFQAGQRLAAISHQIDFAFFEYWLSDYAGHHQNMPQAIRLLDDLDQVLAGLLAAWDYSSGLILLTSDHGNMEDLSSRRHTNNPVPALVIGSPELRQRFTDGLQDLIGITPRILQMLLE